MLEFNLPKVYLVGLCKMLLGDRKLGNYRQEEGTVSYAVHRYRISSREQIKSLNTCRFFDFRNGFLKIYIQAV